METIQEDGESRYALRVRGLRVAFPTAQGVVRAVNGVSFDLARGEILALIGESGSGKTVLSLAMMGVIEPKVGQVTGQVWFKGRDLLQLSSGEIRDIRGKDIAMVPQEPMVSFDPVYPIGVQIAEAMQAHLPCSKREAYRQAVHQLERMQIPQAELRASQYPYQFSGGMAQRALIAMALVCGPEIVIADEATTALDVTVQAQILELLIQLREEMGLAILFITHDMGVAAQIADRVAVMYAGRILEQADIDRLFYEAQHPYTWGLLQCTLGIDDKWNVDLRPIPGMPPDAVNLPKGCKFNPRCPYVMGICREVDPELDEVTSGHTAACHLSVQERDRLRPKR